MSERNSDLETLRGDLIPKESAQGAAETLLKKAALAHRLGIRQTDLIPDDACEGEEPPFVPGLELSPDHAAGPPYVDPEVLDIALGVTDKPPAELGHGIRLVKSKTDRLPGLLVETTAGESFGTVGDLSKLTAEQLQAIWEYIRS